MHSFGILSFQPSLSLHFYTGIASYAAKKGINIYTIGMGTPNGAPIPVFNNGVQTGYRQDKDGNTIITSLNEDMLKEISGIGNGIYIRATTASVGFERIIDNLSGLDQAEFESSMYTDYEDRFQFFLGAAFIFILFAILLNEKKSKWRKKIQLFEE